MMRAYPKEAEYCNMQTQNIVCLHFHHNLYKQNKFTFPMDVAILFSGGKDSTFALQYAKEKGWNIKYLISVKPTRKDCFLFHYATVEQTRGIAEMLNIPHFYIKCSVANPVKEADIVREVVESNQKKMRVDAVVLGGTGLQETQLKSIQNDLVMEEMIKKGYEILVTQIASDGLKDWLGKKITKENFSQLKKDSVKYGFHIGFEGGYADTLVIDCPLFAKRLVVEDMSVIFEDNYCGHVVIDKYRVEEKARKELKPRRLFTSFLR